LNLLYFYKKSDKLFHKFPWNIISRCTAAEIYGIRQLKAGAAAQPKGCSARFVPPAVSHTPDMHSRVLKPAFFHPGHGPNSFPCAETCLFSPGT
jgi:hypothetical protein